MKKTKVFVDGQEGTTGLEINERLQKRDDVEILTIDSEKRKDLDERSKYINQADIVFGNEEQILVVARLDNLGKGASGEAVQNMNIMLGLDETYGLT